VNGFTDSNHVPDAGSIHWPPASMRCFFSSLIVVATLQDPHSLAAEKR
jgi:hypothetical protein